MPLRGQLQLICAADETRGGSFLREQSFRAPMHISKPFRDDRSGMLVVNAINPTAGLFAGDEIACTVRVESGARLLLASPSASRAHRSRRGEAGDGAARVRQEFSVESGGFFEVLPELLIPQAGARYAQRTHVSVAAGGAAILCEMLAPGRVASGESFAFEELDWETEVWHADGLVVREKYRLSPADGSLAALRTAAFPAAYYASFFAIGECFASVTADDACAKICGLHDDTAWIGAGRLVSGGCVVKVLTADSLALRRALREVRALLYSVSGSHAPALRRF